MDVEEFNEFLVLSRVEWMSSISVLWRDLVCEIELIFNVGT
jgi:hypothetical protein